MTARGMVMVPVVLVLLLAVGMASTARGQELSDSRVGFRSQASAPALPRVDQPASPRTNTAILAAAGLLGVYAVTAPVYYQSQDCVDFGCLVPAVIMIVVEPLGAPVAVHLANRRRGRLSPSIGWSYAIMGGTAALGAIFEGSGVNVWPVVLTALPVLQIVSAISVERRAQAEIK